MTCCVSCGIIAASDWEGVAYGGEENGPAPLYTRMVVKDALLELSKEKEFSAITVTDICRVAKISRGTLYLHYKNNSDILDELFNDAPNNVNGVYAQLTQEETESLSYGYPLRLFLRKSKNTSLCFSPANSATRTGGMNHHIAKPFDVAQLISTINEHIESRHTAEFFN